MNVIADPKAIAARRNGGKIVQIVQNVSPRAEQEAKVAAVWRREHGLDPIRKMRKSQGVTLVELLMVIVFLGTLIVFGVGVLWIGGHFLSKYW